MGIIMDISSLNLSEFKEEPGIRAFFENQRFLSGGTDIDFRGKEKKSPDLSQQDINIFIENVLKHIKIKMRE